MASQSINTTCVSTFSGNPHEQSIVLYVGSKPLSLLAYKTRTRNNNTQDFYVIYITQKLFGTAISRMFLRFVIIQTCVCRNLPITLKRYILYHLEKGFTASFKAFGKHSSFNSIVKTRVYQWGRI
jgi:hypothetical protein